MPYLNCLAHEDSTYCRLHCLQKETVQAMAILYVLAGEIAGLNLAVALVHTRCWYTEKYQRDCLGDSGITRFNHVQVDSVFVSLLACGYCSCCLQSLGRLTAAVWLIDFFFSACECETTWPHSFVSTRGRRIRSLLCRHLAPGTARHIMRLFDTSPLTHKHL